MSTWQLDAKSAQIQLASRLFFAALATAYFFWLPEKALLVSGWWVLILFLAYITFHVGWWWRTQNLGLPSENVIMGAALDLAAGFFALVNDPYPIPPTILLLLIVNLSAGIQHGRQLFIYMIIASLTIFAFATPLRQALSDQPANYGFSYLLLFFIACVFYLLVLVQRTEKLQEKSRLLENRDEETGLMNYRAMEQSAGLLLALHERTQMPLVVMVLELVHKNGNQENERRNAMKALGELIENRIRRSDVVARINPHQLVLLLPDSDVKSAETLAREIRESATSLLTQDLALYFGILSAPSDSVAIDRLITHIDTTLIRTKQHENSPTIVFAPAL